MADPESRARRYDNPPKPLAKKGGAAPDKEEAAAKSAAEATAGSGMPSPTNPGKVGKIGSDPGPEGGKDETFGVIAARHKAEHADMLKRHTSDHDAHSKMRQDLVARHHDEAKKMHDRHHKEMADHFETGAEASAEKTAGSPKELGTAKSEGTKGSEP